MAGTFRDSSRVLKVAIASPVCEQFLGMNAQDCAVYLDGHSGRSDKAEKKRLKNSLCLRFLKFRGNCELELTCPISDVSSVPSTASTESYLCTIVLYDES